MTTTVGGSSPVPPAPPPSTPPVVEEPTVPAAGDVYVDGVNAPAELKVKTVKKSAEASAADAIASVFPLADLGQVRTYGRFPAGYRLDAGTVRLMWVHVRRIVEQDGMPGFEIFFWLHGSAVGKFKKRMEEQGAQAAKFDYFTADPVPEAAEGASVLKRTNNRWNPSGQNLQLADGDKFCVDFTPEAPEALRGAMRIRVYGDDKHASESLAGAIKRLGLQSVFAPPTPRSLERYKLFRFMWAVAPSAAETLRWRDNAELSEEQLLGELEKLGAGADNPEVKAVMEVDLTNERIRKHYHLAKFLLSKSFGAFLDWVKADGYVVNGILPNLTYNYDTSYALNNALNALGVAANSEVYNAEANKPDPPAAEARHLFLLGLLAKKSRSVALDLFMREVDDIKVGDMKKALSASGVDLSSDRLGKLAFEEVYPGYFTVVDPSLPDRLKTIGARYLYSTLDNAERVWQALTGGQKASMTRFQEGLLIQGKSSARDFETGGAFGVFTRLVTQSAIDKAIASAATDYVAKFNNWGGSRPFKLILDREMLARTDWWGFNGDNFGRSTGLTDQNHAEKVVKTISDTYSASNELIFPIGNDPSYIRYVVCESDQAKADLIKFLNEKGFTSHEGMPLEELVRVEQKVFDLPEDAVEAAAGREAAKAAAAPAPAPTPNPSG